MAKDARPLSKTERTRLKNIGKHIRNLRESKGLTLEQVEDRGYPSWKHLQAVESGRKNFTITSLFRLAEALGVEAKEIIT